MRRTVSALVSMLLVLCAGAVAAAPVATAPVKLAPVKLSYEGYLGPFFVLSAAVELRFEDGRYRLAASGRTEGFAAWFFDWENRAVSEGRRFGRALAPERHRMRAVWNDRERRVRLHYRGTAPVIDLRNPPPGEVENGPVPVALTLGTVDPLTMALRLMARVETDGCGRDFRIFDGRRRYDLRFRPGSVADLPDSASSVFNGRAIGCAMAIDRIAGFWDDSKLVTDALAPPMVWMARPMAGVPMLPVRFEAAYKFGDLRIYLTRLETAGRVLAMQPD